VDSPLGRMMMAFDCVDAGQAWIGDIFKYHGVRSIKGLCTHPVSHYP